MKTSVYFLRSVTKHFLLFIFLFSNLQSSTIFAQSPGGVSSSLMLWLKANAGTSTSTNGAAMSQWNDQSGNSRHATQSSSSQQAAYKNNSSDNMNFNSVVDFTAGNYNSFLLPTSVLPNGTGAFSIYIVSRRKSTAGMTIVGLGINSNNQSINVGTNGDALARFHTYNNGWAPSVSTMVNDAVIQSSYNFESGVRYLSVNSTSYGSSAAGINLATGGAYIGANHNGSNVGNFEGEIGEVVIYSSNSNSTDKSKIESYLSMKYGITKSGDYVNSSNAVIWNSSANSTYHNNVAILGRDDGSGMVQKQSRSVNSGFQPVIGNGAILDASNSANTSTFTNNQSFLSWGSNTLATTFSTPYQEGNRMARIWKVQKTGTIGAVKVGVLSSDVAGVSYLNMLVSNDATFDNTDVRYQMNAETVGGVNYFTTVADLSDGQYFNFMSSSSPLPVTLLDFKTYCDENTNEVTVSWKTSDEITNSHFILERSEDGNQWNEIQKIPFNETSNYSFPDKKTTSNPAYYRLTQYDLNGGTKTYPVIESGCTQKLSEPTLDNYPNPGETGFMITYISSITSDKAVIRLIDPMGSIIYEQNALLNIGENTFNVERAHSSPGIYTVELFDGYDISLKRRQVLR